MSEARSVLLAQAIERLEQKQAEIAGELSRDLAHWQNAKLAPESFADVVERAYADAWRALSRAVRAECGTLKLLVEEASTPVLSPEEREALREARALYLRTLGAARYVACVNLDCKGVAREGETTCGEECARKVKAESASRATFPTSDGYRTVKGE